MGNVNVGGDKVDEGLMKCIVRRIYILFFYHMHLSKVIKGTLPKVLW